MRERHGPARLLLKRRDPGQPDESTAVTARSRQSGNWLSTSSRTIPGETVSWPSCIVTHAAFRTAPRARNRSAGDKAKILTRAQQ
jgi:hypothetical protein